MPYYLKFVNLANFLKEEFIRAHAIDRRGLKLLEAISIQHSLNQSWMTTDVMALSQFGSPAAIHRKTDVPSTCARVRSLNNTKTGLSLISRRYKKA